MHLDLIYFGVQLLLCIVPFCHASALDDALARDCKSLHSSHYCCELPQLDPSTLVARGCSDGLISLRCFVPNGTACSGKVYLGRSEVFAAEQVNSTANDSAPFVDCNGLKYDLSLQVFRIERPCKGKGDVPWTTAM